MATPTTTSQGINLEERIQQVLSTIDREREREIIARRFGLYERKETLEQIGELLGVTRERVRQLEKSILTQLKDSASKGNIPGLQDSETAILDLLQTNGRLMRVTQLADIISSNNSGTGFYITILLYNYI